jgi:hypothetical protein
MPEQAKLAVDPLGNSFGLLMSQFRNGGSGAELSEKLQELTRAVQQTGKTGSLTYKIIVKPMTGGAFVVTDQIAAKIPEAPRDAAVFYATEQGVLQREDPNQRKLDLREVNRPEPEVRELPRLAAVAKAK